MKRVLITQEDSSKPYIIAELKTNAFTLSQRKKMYKDNYYLNQEIRKRRHLRQGRYNKDTYSFIEDESIISMIGSSFLIWGIVLGLLYFTFNY